MISSHPFQEGFLAAMRKEINSLSEKETFEIINRPRDRGQRQKHGVEPGALHPVLQ
jgi:hypothetical protein